MFMSQNCCTFLQVVEEASLTLYITLVGPELFLCSLSPHPADGGMMTIYEMGNNVVMKVYVQSRNRHRRGSCGSVVPDSSTI